MIWRVIVQVLLFHPGLCKQQLVLRPERQVVRNMQVLKDLLRDPPKYRRRDLSALM